MSGPYDDIINLPHHVSDRHPQMPRENRAAQFSPFAALTGYNEALKETARITDERRELSDVALAELDMKLNILADLIDEHPEITVMYFQPDGRKDGGAYVTAVGEIKKIDEYEQAIVLMSGEKIPLCDVSDIKCELFSNWTG